MRLHHAPLIVALGLVLAGHVGRAQAAPVAGGALRGAADGASTLLWNTAEVLDKPVAGALTGTKVYEKLRRESMGQVAGCNYLGYLKLADSLSGAHLPDFKFKDWKNPFKGHGFPLTDYLSTVMSGLGGVAAKKSTAGQEDALVYQIETVCNSLKQANESERIARLMQSTRKGVGGVVKQLLKESGLTFGHLKHTSGKDLAERWSKMYASERLAMGYARDSVALLSDTYLRANMIASDDMAAQLGDLEAQLGELQRELRVYATQDSAGSPWTCPPGYPDPNRPDAVLSTEPLTRGRPICGAASPERALQLTAQAKLIIVRAKVIELTAGARANGADAIITATQDLQKRQHGYAHRFALDRDP